MPNAERIAERIAELQRLAYGAGSTDAERHAALDELAAIRDGRAVDATVASGTDATDPDDGAAGAASVRDPSLATLLAAAGAEPGAHPAARRHLHWAAVAGVLALAVGYSVGSITTGQASGAAPLPTATPEPSATPMPLEAPPGAVVDVDETRVVEIFEREPTEADLAVDTTMFSFEEMDAASPRLLATRSDGMAVWAARTADGDVCLAMRIDEFSAGGTCTMGGLFPVSEGLGMETYVAEASTQGGGYYSAHLDQWGDLSMRVAGISAGPRVMPG